MEGEGFEPRAFLSAPTPTFPLSPHMGLYPFSGAVTGLHPSGGSGFSGGIPSFPVMPFSAHAHMPKPEIPSPSQESRTPASSPRDSNSGKDSKKDSNEKNCKPELKKSMLYTIDKILEKDDKHDKEKDKENRESQSDGETRRKRCRSVSSGKSFNLITYKY